MLSTTFVQFAGQAGNVKQQSGVGDAVTFPDGVTNLRTVDSASTNLLTGAVNLQTLHEDVELKLVDGAHTLKSSTLRPKLTSDLLLRTQDRRLEVRPQG